MQRRWVRRLSPRVLVVALCSVAMVVTAVAVSQADPRSDRAVSVAMLSGGNAAPLPAADMAVPGSTAAAEAAPESPPPTEPSTTTTSAADTAAGATIPTAKQKPCPTNGAPDRPCGPPCPHPGQGTEPARCPPPPCPQPGSANSATACPPPCAQPAAPPAGAAPVASNGTAVEPAGPACPPPPPPTCRQYDLRTGTSQPCPPPCPPSDPAGNSSSCPQPCPALATADGKPAPCPPPPCPQPQYDNGVTQSAYACPPPPCAYPTEPDGGTGASQSQVMIYCPPPCYDTPNSGGTSCPPPPCPSAMPTDQSCTPPCSYEPTAGGPAAGAFAPCASGVTDPDS